jgi:hypothetical protein
LKRNQTILNIVYIEHQRRLKMIKKLFLFLALILILPACAPSPQSTTENTLVPPATEVSVDVITAPETMCPVATEGLKLFVNTTDGYCLLYPAAYSLHLESPRLIISNPLDASFEEPGAVWMDIQVSAANGQTAAQVVDAKVAEWGDEYNITRTEITIDGRQAIVVDGIPGQDPYHQVFIVDNDRLVQLNFGPWYPSSDPSQPTALEILYTTILDSLRFLPTNGAVAAPADACPTETTDMKLLVNNENGYCVLYPAGYSTDIPNHIVINPASATADTPGDAWSRFMIEPAAGRTAAQVADGKIADGETILGVTIPRKDVLVNGVPAVVVDGLPGVDSARTVFIVSNDRLYTLIFMPWFPSNDPSQPTPLESLYTIVMSTLHFLP